MTTADAEGPQQGPEQMGAADAADEIAASWERERPGTRTESIGVVTRLWQLAKLFGDDRRRVLADAGVDSATLDLLSVLRRRSSPYRCTTRELTELTLVTAGATSQRVARAEREGLVVRWTDPVDRSVWVELTSAGHVLVERTVDQVLSREAELLDGMEPSQRQELAALLRNLLRDVQTRQGGHGVSHVGETDLP